MPEPELYGSRKYSKFSQGLAWSNYDKNLWTHVRSMGSEAFSFEVKVCMHVNTQPVPADSTNAKSDILKVRERKTRTFRILENHANNVKNTFLSSILFLSRWCKLIYLKLPSAWFCAQFPDLRYVVLDSDTGILYKNQLESLSVSLLIPIPYILNRKAFLNKTR